MARDDDRLAVRIAEIAAAHLSKVDPEDVAFDLHEELNVLEVEEVWDRAGPTRHGYAEPSEAAYQMTDEVIEPFLAQMKKHQKLGMDAQANRLCMGLAVGAVPV